MSGSERFSPRMGSFWVGHPGALYPIHARVQPYQIKDEQKAVFSVAIGGGVRARVPRIRAPRSWKVDVPGMYPQDVVVLRELLASTIGPYVWVDPWSRVTNLLTPEESTLVSPVSPSTLAQNGGGWPLIGLDGQVASQTRSNPGGTPVWVGTVPVPPDYALRPVTGSAWLSSADSTRVHLQWLDGSGSVVSAVSGNVVTGLDGLRRSVVTATPPWGAGVRSARLYITGATVLARPAITWTDAPVPWDVGNGVRRVVIDDLSRDILEADPAQRRSDLSFTVTEVGPPGVIA